MGTNDQGNGEERNSKPQVDDEFILAQYEQAFSYLREHDKLLWQTPSVAAAINGGILFATFRIVDRTIVQGSLLLIAILLTSSLTIALIKHRYFMKVEAQTIQSIEEYFEAPSIQRGTYPDEDRDYWFSKEPEGFARLSASVYLIWGMVLSVGVLVGILLRITIL